MGEFAATGQGEAGKWLKAFGFDVEKLKGLRGDELFRTYADAISHLSDRGQQLAAVAGLMGDEARDLTPLILAGGSAMRDAAAEAAQYGLAVSKFDAAKIEAVNDNFTRIGAVTRGLANTIAIELAPVILSVTDDMLEAAKKTGGFKDAIHQAAQVGVDALISVLRSSQTVVNFIDNNPDMAWGGVIGYTLLGKQGLALGATIGTVVDAVNKSMGTGNFIVDRIHDVNAEIAITRMKIETLNKALNERGTTIGGKVQDFFAGLGLGATREDAEQNVQSLRDHLDELQGRLIALHQGLAQDPEAQNILKDQEQDVNVFNVAINALIASLEKAKTKIVEIKDTGGLKEAFSLGADATGPGAEFDAYLDNLRKKIDEIDKETVGGVESIRNAYANRVKIVQDAVTRGVTTEQRGLDILEKLSEDSNNKINKQLEQDYAYRRALAERLNSDLLSGTNSLISAQIALENIRAQKAQAVAGASVSALVDLERQRNEATTDDQRKAIDTQIKLEQHRLEQANKAAKKAFAENKKLQRLNVVINTASGIARAFADLPYWAAVPVAALVAATGAKQLEAIDSQSFSAATVPSGGIPSAAANAQIPGSAGGEGDSNQAGVQKVVNFYITGAITRELAREMAGYIKEDINDYDFVLIENYSQNGQRLTSARAQQ